MADAGLPVALQRDQLAQARTLGRAALVAILAFAATAALLQGLRDDLDWVRAPLSFYLVGPYGLWLQAAYVALAAAMAMLGVGYYRAASPGARRIAPLLMFLLGAVALTVTAVAETDFGGGRELTMSAYVHAISAPLAFLGTVLGMLWQSWSFRADPRWRRNFAIAFGLAVFCFAALLLHALWRELPRGLSQKAVVAAILGWLALAAWWLRRAPVMNTD